MVSPVPSRRLPTAQAAARQAVSAVREVNVKRHRAHLYLCTTTPRAADTRSVAHSHGASSRFYRARAVGSLLQYGITPAVTEQEWMLSCNSPSKSSIERWSRQLFKMPIGYVGYVGYNNQLPYMGE